MTRFLLVALPLLLLLMALFGLALDVMDLEPGTGELARFGVSRSAPPPLRLEVGDWLMQSLGLTALFLLVQGRSGAWWLDGLVAGWIAWVFRGPVMPGTGFVLATKFVDGEPTGEREEVTCIGDSIDVLNDPSCGIADPAALFDALCRWAPEALCFDD